MGVPVSRDSRSVRTGTSPFCLSPYHKTGKLIIWSGTSLTTLSTKDNALFKEADLPAYFDALVADGVNSERSFAYFCDGDADWESYLPCNPGFYEHLTYRLGLIKERDLTEIMTLTPYGGQNSDDEIRGLIRRTKSFSPNIVYHAVNEPQNNDRQKRIVEISHEEGIENKFIMIEYMDSSDFTKLLQEDLNGEGLASYHRVGSMETINAPWPVGWSTSSGTMDLMKIGMGGSCDGSDITGNSRGLRFWYHVQHGIMGYERPDNQQLYNITKWMLANGKHYEDLSAAGFQESESPNLKKAIENGKIERQKMYQAYVDYSK